MTNKSLACDQIFKADTVWMSILARCLPVVMLLDASLLPGQTERAYSLDSIISIKTVVVTSTRQHTNKNEVPYALHVLRQKKMEQVHSRTTPEALVGAPGIWVQKTNHGGGSPFIRGLTGNQTLTLIDGIRLNNPTFRYGPNQYLNTIDPFSIERVEVLKGSGSVQYGSDALGGVIHLFTHEPRFSRENTWSGNLMGRLVSGGMEYSGRGALEYSCPKLAFRAGGTWRSFGDLMAGGQTVQRPSGYEERSFDGKVKWLLSEHLTITGAHQYTRQRDVPLYHRVALDNFQFYQFDPQDRQLSYLRLTSHRDQAKLRRFALTLSHQHSNEVRSFRRNMSNTYTREEDRVRMTGLTGDMLWQITPSWSFNSGVEFYYAHVASMRQVTDDISNQTESLRGLYPDGATSGNLSAYMLHHLHAGPWRLEGGMRYNYFSYRIPNNDQQLNDGMDVQISPDALVANVAVSYLLGKGHTLFGSFSTGYRAPNINDLGTLGLVDFRYELPAYDLKPERTYSTEIGYRLHTDRFDLSGSGFYMHLTDLINRRRLNEQVNGVYVYLKENSLRSYIRGLDFEFNYRWSSQWALSAYTSYTFGQNLSAGEPMRRIPPCHGGTRLTYQKKQFTILLEHLFAGSQLRLSGGDRDDNRIGPDGTPGWQVVNLYAQIKLQQFSLQLGFQNMGDVRYRLHGSGIDAVGRSLSLSASYSF